MLTTTRAQKRQLLENQRKSNEDQKIRSVSANKSIAEAAKEASNELKQFLHSMPKAVSHVAICNKLNEVGPNDFVQPYAERLALWEKQKEFQLNIINNALTPEPLKYDTLQQYLAGVMAKLRTQHSDLIYYNPHSQIKDYMVVTLLKLGIIQCYKTYANNLQKMIDQSLPSFANGCDEWYAIVLEYTMVLIILLQQGLYDNDHWKTLRLIKLCTTLNTGYLMVEIIRNIATYRCSFMESILQNGNQITNTHVKDFTSVSNTVDFMEDLHTKYMKNAFNAVLEFHGFAQKGAGGRL